MVFFTYEDIRRDLEFCCSLGIIDKEEQDNLLILLKKSKIIYLNQLTSRPELGNKLIKWITANTQYGFLDKNESKTYLNLVRKIWANY